MINSVEWPLVKWYREDERRIRTSFAGSPDATGRKMVGKKWQAGSYFLPPIFLPARMIERGGPKLRFVGVSAGALFKISNMLFRPGEIAAMRFVDRQFHTFVIDHPEAPMGAVGIKFVVVELPVEDERAARGRCGPGEEMS